MVYVTIKLAICGRFSAHLFQKFKDRIEILDGPLNKKKITLFIVGMWLNILGAKMYQSSYFKIYTISESILLEDQLYIVYAKMRNDFFKKP